MGRPEERDQDIGVEQVHAHLFVFLQFADMTCTHAGGVGRQIDHLQAIYNPGGETGTNSSPDKLGNSFTHRN